MNKIEIKSNDYKIVQFQDDLILLTTELNEEIALAAVSLKLGKVGLARNLSKDQLAQFFAEINPDNLHEVGLINIKIVGGDASEGSKLALSDLITQLQEIDNNYNIIDIKTCDACDHIHPNSFEVDGYHGGIRVLTGDIL